MAFKRGKHLSEHLKTLDRPGTPFSRPGRYAYGLKRPVGLLLYGWGSNVWVLIAILAVVLIVVLVAG